MKVTVAAWAMGSPRRMSSLTKTKIIRLWFNIIMLRGYQPDACRRNRTTLLPKDGLDPAKISNYRPITIVARFWRGYIGG